MKEVLGSERRPTMKDRTAMPYTSAALQEIQRIACIAETTLFHTCIEDADLGGFTIPAGSQLLASIFAVHNNPKFFPNPTKFDPTRFLSEDGKSLVKNEYLMPFGMGKRVCLGESMARAELFLIFSTLIQKFSFGTVEGNFEPIKRIHPITPTVHVRDSETTQ